MSKKEIGLIAAMGLTIILGVLREWGGTAEMWGGLTFLAGALFGFWARALPTPPYWVFKGPDASRTWGLVVLYHGVFLAMGYNLARQPAATDFLKVLKGDHTAPYALAGVISLLGLLVSMVEMPRVLSRFFRAH